MVSTMKQSELIKPADSAIFMIPSHNAITPISPIAIFTAVPEYSKAAISYFFHFKERDFSKIIDAAAVESFSTFVDKYITRNIILIPGSGSNISQSLGIILSIKKMDCIIMFLLLKVMPQDKVKS